MPGTPNAADGAASAGSDFFTTQKLLARPRLARFYTDLLINSPTTIPEARERLDMEKSTAHKYSNELAEMGIAESSDEHRDGAAVWEATPIDGVWHGTATFEVGPTVFAVFGAQTIDEDIEMFTDRHGEALLPAAIVETIHYLEGRQTRRGVADALDVHAVEGVAISQAVERIIGVVGPGDPTIDMSAFEVEIHEQALAEAPYIRD
ncbi:DUF7437 domain-containing protein [Haloarcula litorea]|uniref:DUF7437 domain-containing protein n=1 Tax=Haloarcula litorea TaxID=3032579 RepID=UPI0023E83BEC|nr:hypothetical protein [Halomicroarcula sp. GDY20]